MNAQFLRTAVAGALLLVSVPALAANEPIFMPAQACQGERQVDRNVLLYNSKSVANEGTATITLTCPFKLPQAQLSNISLIGVEAWDRNATSDVRCSVHVVNSNGDVLVGSQGGTFGVDQVGPKQFFLTAPAGVDPSIAGMSLICGIPPMDAGSRSGLLAYHFNAQLN